MFVFIHTTPYSLQRIEKKGKKMHLAFKTRNLRIHSDALLNPSYRRMFKSLIHLYIQRLNDAKSF